MISLYATANRPEFWQRWHALISRNLVPLEIVFCGNVAPGFELPPNFHWVHSDFKPAQCQAIAASKCTGDLMMNVVDDFDYTPNLFDVAEIMFAADPNLALCVLPKMTSDDHPPGTDFTMDHWRLIDHDMGSPQIPQQAIFRRSFFESVGGYSRLFIGSAQEQDLAMRMVRAPGYKLVTLDDHFATERFTWKPATAGASLYARIGPPERVILDELWIEDGTRPFGFGGRARLSPAGRHQPYNVPTVEIIEQGPSLPFVRNQDPHNPGWHALAGRIVRGEYPSDVCR